jgi:hypothetical protein
MRRWDHNWFYFQMPEQTADVRGRGTYPLSCTMTPLNYASEVTFECGPIDANVVAFTEAALTIGGHNAIEEFLACGLWLMPQVTPIIGAQDPGSTSKVRIANATCSLVGNYNTIEHKA